MKMVQRDTVNVAKKELSPRRDVFNAHLSTDKHAENVHPEANNEVTQLERDLAFAKLKLAGLYVDRNLPFLLCDYELPVFQQIAKDSEILQNLDLNRLDIKDII